MYIGKRAFGAFYSDHIGVYNGSQKMWDSLYTILCQKTFLTSILKSYMRAHTRGMHVHAPCMCMDT